MQQEIRSSPDIAPPLSHYIRSMGDISKDSMDGSKADLSEDDGRLIEMCCPIARDETLKV